MKKLFLSLAAMLMCGAAFAQEAGTYAYTTQGKVKITGESNLVVNGDFNNNSANGWTNDQGGKVNVTDSLTIVEGAGPDGSSCIYTVMKDNGPMTGSTMMQKVPVEFGTTYYISYDVKTDDTFTSTTAYGSEKNYQGVFFNVSGQLLVDGALNSSVNIAQAVTTEAGSWKTVKYSFTAPKDGYLFFYIYAPYVGQCFDNFVVKEAKYVPDENEAAACKARLQKYIDDNPDFTNWVEDMNGVIAQFDECIANDDVEQFNVLKSVMDTEIIPTFLDANTVDISERLSCPHFDNATTGSLGTATSFNGWSLDWTGTKSRWSVQAGATDNEPYTTNYLSRSIPYGTSNILSKSAIYQSVNLPKGKYMFTMRVNARRYTNKTNALDPDPQFTTMKVFMGNDTVVCTDVDSVAMYRYAVYTTLTSDTTVNVGFAMDESKINLMAVDLTELRAIDNTKEDIEAYDNKATFAAARQALADEIALAQECYNSADYVFEKALLNDSIVKSQGVYDAITEYSENNLADVNNQTKRLVRGVSYFKKMNTEYVALAAAIKDGNDAIADDAITGDKSGITKAVNAASTYYNSLTTESTRDSLALATYAADITSAVSAARAASISDDEMYPFATWASGESLVYVSKLADEASTVSSGATTMYEETGTFNGNNLNSRFALNNSSNCQPDIEEGKGWKIMYSGKNAQFFSVLGLKEGNEVKVDWSTNGSLYCVSMNAKYYKADGTEVTLTKSGKDASNVITVENTKGLAGSNRTSFTMTADGTLDFYTGASNKTFYIYYVGINQESTAVRDVNASVTTTKANGIYNIAGQKVGKNYKGIIIVNGKKFCN